MGLGWLDACSGGLEVTLSEGVGKISTNADTAVAILAAAPEAVARFVLARQKFYSLP